MTSPVNEELSRRRLIYLIVSIVFSLNCFVNLAFTAWKNSDPKLPITMGSLDMWNLASVGIALPFILAFLMAFDCDCAIQAQFSKFLFVLFAGLSLVSLIVNYLLNVFSPDTDLFLQIFGYKPGNLIIDLSLEQIKEIDETMTSIEMATEILTTIFKDEINTKIGTYSTSSDLNYTLTTTSKLFAQLPTERYFAVNNEEKILINNVVSSSDTETVILLSENFKNVKETDIIKIIKETDYNSQKNFHEKDTRKRIEDTYQNVDAKYKKHPLNYYMRNVWLWSIFSITLFTHSIIVYHRFSFSKKNSSSSPDIDLSMIV
tara:strand:+ start:3626 stop:4576 length:951 start_codon:yes stop_codon:yes gene_type:complete